MESKIGEHESVTTAVLRAVSAVTGMQPDPLHPLYEVVDPDALDALFGRRPNGVPRTGGRLSFNYSRCRITIDDGEVLTIEPFESMERLPAQADGTDREESTSSSRDSHRAATLESPGSRICVVCQQPIERENLQRERGELAHQRCRAELRYQIPFEA